MRRTNDESAVTPVFTPEYTALADIYDIVMTDVDYETWTDYIDEIILKHNPEAADILELACGTGTMALSLEELDCYHITATDGSPDMIRVAKEKGRAAASGVRFRAMNVLDLQFREKFDVVYMVFDSLNYLKTDHEIIRMHQEVKKVLNPGGIFIYDFTTPRNSRKAISYLNNDSGKAGDHYYYYRDSRYDPREKIHTNTFKIHKLHPKTGHVVETSREEHHQKIYTYPEISSFIKKTDFRILKAYDGFALKPAHTKSLRITMVLQ